MITHEEFLKAQLIILEYKNQQKKYLESVKKDLNNKNFENENYTLDTLLYDCDLSVGTMNCLKVLEIGRNTKLSDCIGLKKKDLHRIRCFGEKRIAEFERLLNSVGVFLL